MAVQRSTSPRQGVREGSWEKRQKLDNLIEESGEGVFQVEDTMCRKNGWLEKLEEVISLEQGVWRGEGFSPKDQQQVIGGLKEIKAGGKESSYNNEGLIDK